jgi:hypothetical protein
MQDKLIEAARHRKLANAITAARGREPDPPVQP